MTAEYSIIIPMYNAENSIETVLRSIFANAPEKTEVIVVDDSSTDGSVEILSSYPVKLIEHPENKGPSAARNTGVRAAKNDLLLFVDSDVEILDGALAALCSSLNEEPELLGANGTVSLNVPFDGLISAYVNTSLHFQLRRHGKRVNTCFTSLCLMKREAWEQMSGWDEAQRSRYADDVHTRWHFPKESIEQVDSAQFIHHKSVPFGGLLKHRANIGYHFARSLNRQSQTQPKWIGRSVVHHRYPINTVLGLLLIPSLFHPLSTLLVLTFLFLNNLRFFFFTLRKRGIIESILIFPLSLLEGIAYAIGVFIGLWSELFARR